MKKLWLNIKLFLISLAWGMKGADKIIANSNKDTEEGDITGIEQHKETNSVYADLLKGEVTQEVKEFRHEMYYSERKSHDYEYGGNGRAVKKNNVFGFGDTIEQSDGYKVRVIQDNHEDPSSLMEFGIYHVGEEVFLDKKALMDFKTKDKRDFTIKITRDFMPSFRLEQYATKIVVKTVDKTHSILDVYVSAYPKQFDKNSEIFLKKIGEIENGNVRSDIIDFSELEFITYGATGADDLLLFKYGDIKYKYSVRIDGNIILKFEAETIKDGEDLITEFYDETAAQKSENHEMREGATYDITLAVDTDNYDVDKAIEISKQLVHE